MRPWIVEIGIAAASFGAWFGLYGLMLLASRPARVAPGPATQDLGAETPALASIVGNGWELTEQAVEATLVDLGARRVVEFRQPAADPRHTTIHIVQKDPVGLNRYERRVFDRVAGLAVDGIVPLTALGFRDKRKARSWWKVLRAEIVADARASGLSQRRFSPGQLLGLGFAAVLATAGVDVAIGHWAARQPPTTNSDDDPMGLVIGATIFVLAGLIGFAGRNIGERDTPAGREAAARWLGVKAWLRGHEAFSDLPPSAVATWDRYIGYGVALGASRVVSTVIDLGMGDRRLVWSSFGDTWHRVRISYPHLWWRYGRSAPTLIFRALIAVGLGFALVRWWRAGVEWASVHFVHASRSDPVVTVGSALGVALLAYGGYTGLRAIADAASRRTITGQVLWKQVWRTSSGGEDSPRIPWLYHLAVDDGRADRTRAWGLPSELSHNCDTGDTVTIKVRRWSRRVTELTVDSHRSAGHDIDTGSADAAHEALVAGVSGGRVRGLLSPPALAPGQLLTAGEVSQALGLAVQDAPQPMPGPVAGLTFRTADGKRAVLLLQVIDGPLANLAWRSNSKGQPVPGIGDAAFVNGNRAAARQGDTLVVLTLLGLAKRTAAAAKGDRLADLLRQALGRVSAGEAGA